MRLILYEFISLSFKRWFSSDRVYLRLELFSDGTWYINPHTNYQIKSINKSDWKRIRRQGKKEIIKYQKDCVFRYFKSTNIINKSRHNYQKEMTVGLVQCYKIIENNYKSLFEDKI